MGLTLNPEPPTLVHHHPMVKGSGLAVCCLPDWTGGGGGGARACACQVARSGLLYHVLVLANG